MGRLGWERGAARSRTLDLSPGGGGGGGGGAEREARRRVTDAGRHTSFLLTRSLIQRPPLGSDGSQRELRSLESAHCV